MYLLLKMVDIPLQTVSLLEGTTYWIRKFSPHPRPTKSQRAAASHHNISRQRIGAGPRAFGVALRAHRLPQLQSGVSWLFKDGVFSWGGKSTTQGLNGKVGASVT